MQYKKLGKFVRDKREKLKISLNEFSFNANIEPATLSNFETGKSGVAFDTLIKIAHGFNQTAGEFLIEFEQQNNN